MRSGSKVEGEILPARGSGGGGGRPQLSFATDVPSNSSRRSDHLGMQVSSGALSPTAVAWHGAQDGSNLDSDSSSNRMRLLALQDPQAQSSSSSSSSSASKTVSTFHQRSQSLTEVNSNPDLVRRHHTLSTSSSRLVRLERSKARAALQDMGLSEQDQAFYVPPSPVRSSPSGFHVNDAHLPNTGDQGSFSREVLDPSGSGWDSDPLLSPKAADRSADSTNTSGVHQPRFAILPPAADSGETSKRRPLNGESLGSAWTQKDPHVTTRNLPSPEVSSFEAFLPGPSFLPPPSPTTSSTFECTPIASPPISPVSPPSTNKRSSFVVLRGAKGDAALSERRSPAGAISNNRTLPTTPLLSPRPDSTSSQYTSSSGLKTPMSSTQNSLKPFLEAEAVARSRGGGEEDWERGLLEERDKEYEHLRNSDPRARSNLVHSHSLQPRASASTSAITPRSVSDPWLGTDDRAPSAVEPLSRESSLRLHHLSGQAVSSSGSSSTGPGLSPDPWAVMSSSSYSKGSLGSSASLSSSTGTAAPTELLAALTLGPLSNANASASASASVGSGVGVGVGGIGGGGGGFSRSGSISSRPLSFQSASLSHSNSYSSHYGGSNGGHGSGGSGNLSHSNSFSSHHSPNDGSRGSGSGALSPVGGFSRSPWSPTLEETKQLGMTAVNGGGGTRPVTPPPPPSTAGLSRGGSTSSSRGSIGRGRTAGGVGPSGSGLGDLSDPSMSSLGEEEEDRIAALPTSPNPSINKESAYAAPFSSTLPSSSSNLSTGLSRVVIGDGSSTAVRRLPPLMTNSDLLATLSGPSVGGVSVSPTLGKSHSLNYHQQSFLARQGPASAAAYVPPIGHSHAQYTLSSATFTAPKTNVAQPPTYRNNSNHSTTELALEENKRAVSNEADDTKRTMTGALTAAPSIGASKWTKQKEILMGNGREERGTEYETGDQIFQNGAQMNSEITLDENYDGVNPASTNDRLTEFLDLPPQKLPQVDLLQEKPTQSAQALNHDSRTGSRDRKSPDDSPPPKSIDVETKGNPTVLATADEMGIDSPIDVPTLIAQKGYNPTNFDCRPDNARFFVIKSYTEEDVHKSLKYEIWASTDLGNKRLDRAFRESADKGPIYLFFSVNGSGHFAGMAQMLTPIDYSMSSSVWASDKWKGVLKVRWIYIKDVPLGSLRHIRLSNTPENKPVTSSRDTQEVPYDAGCEVLRILSTFQSRTSLLQDVAWYEARMQQEAAELQRGTNDSKRVESSSSSTISYPPHYTSRSSSNNGGMVGAGSVNGDMARPVGPYPSFSQGPTYSTFQQGHPQQHPYPLQHPPSHPRTQPHPQLHQQQQTQPPPHQRPHLHQQAPPLHPSMPFPSFPRMDMNHSMGAGGPGGPGMSFPSMNLMNMGMLPLGYGVATGRNPAPAPSTTHGIADDHRPGRYR